MKTRTRSMIALTAAAGLALTACGGNWSQSDVESELADAFDEEFPEDEPHEFSCPGDLEAEEGESMDCEFTDTSGTGLATVEIVEVDGSDIHYETEILDYAPSDG